jgi:mono/diheme cytochrome c family protein
MFVSLLGALLLGTALADPGDPTAGEATYQAICIACHGADGRGPVGANLVDDETRLAKSDEELLKSISEGQIGELGAMPPLAGALDEQQQRDVLAYIRAAFGKQTREAASGGPAPALTTAASQ